MNFIKNFLLDRRVGVGSVRRERVSENTDAYETPPEWYLKLGSLVPVFSAEKNGRSFVQ